MASYLMHIGCRMEGGREEKLARGGWGGCQTLTCLIWCSTWWPPHNFVCCTSLSITTHLSIFCFSCHTCLLFQSQVYKYGVPIEEARISTGTPCSYSNLWKRLERRRARVMVSPQHHTTNIEITVFIFVLIWVHQMKDLIESFHVITLFFSSDNVWNCYGHFTKTEKVDRLELNG